MRDWGIRSTVIVFGSARIMPAPEQRRSGGAGAALPPGGHRHARPPVAAHCAMTRRGDFARIVSERGGALNPVDGVRDNVIATGGGPGIMEAANRGADDAGAPSIGFNIELPHEQEPNAYSTPDLTFQFHYFAMRKMHFAMRAERARRLSRRFRHLRRAVRDPDPGADPQGAAGADRAVRPRLLAAAGQFRRAGRGGHDRAADLDLFSFADTPEEAWAELLKLGLVAHTPEGEQPA